MAFLEWRRFSFFDIHKNVDNGKIASSLEDTNVTVSTSGNNHVVLCDVTGWAHLISRSWEITSFKAYELTVTLAQQLPHDPYLITIGDDEVGVNPTIKVWDWSRTDRHGNPICVRMSRAVPSHMRPTPATALAVHDNKNLLAVGFQDGSVALFRGDVTRQRSSKMRTLPDCGSSPITGLAFNVFTLSDPISVSDTDSRHPIADTMENTLPISDILPDNVKDRGTDKLFVVSRASVAACWLDTERRAPLHELGAAPGCSVLADRHRLTVATSDAIYCYTTDGRGPCYALEGEKVRLNCFRSYLVITTRETAGRALASTSQAPAPNSHHITILDIQNKFIVFSHTFEETDAVITEWGSFYIITKKKELIYLDEKDLQSKLSLLFKKNLYDVAIRIASSQHYDVEGLTEIYKQYGDHLYSKGDLKGAIDQYIKTIGWLETSYVIRKYLESRQLEPLVQYLEELHKKGCAADSHTTLLLTCYVKIDQHDQQGRMKSFINSKERTIDFDVEVAIKVVRQVSVEDALSLAANYGRHDWYLRLALDDRKAYVQALRYVARLGFDDAELYARRYGHRLLQHEPDDTTELLIQLCTGYVPHDQPLVAESALAGGGSEAGDDVARARPEDFIYMFLSDSQRLIYFLERVTALDRHCSKVVYNTLIEHYIHVWAKSSGEEKSKYEEKVMTLLQDPNVDYDKDQTLVICQMLGFKNGILYLYEESKLWRAQVSLHLRGGEPEAALAVCRRRGAACPRLWLDVLWARPPPRCLPELLNVIGNEKLLSPILVIDCLASTPTYTLGDVRNYLMSVLKSEAETAAREGSLAAKYRAESARGKAHIAALRREPVVFQSSRCAACSRPLELPTVHFLCQHSYHQHCFQSYTESEECPACSPQRRSEPPPRSAEALHARLRTDPDPYAVVSEYFGRGLFNKVTVVTEASPAPPPPPGPAPAPGPAPPPPAPAPAPAANYGPGAEAKLRLQEGQSNVFVSNASRQMAPKGTAVVPVPEGRMRLLERPQYSSSLEANISNLEPKTFARSSPRDAAAARSLNPHDQPKSGGGSPKISAAITNDSGTNPFEEHYDETKNPFADDPTNPFEEADDYDANLNPFS